jgi:dihydroxyacetone kinase-like predicted kinase
VLNIAQKYGEFLTLKIENMSVGHNEEVKKQKKKREKLSVLAVASGDGICALFTDMGAAGIISGGQTANPSTEEFIEAFKKYDAENIIVLPNNKNVILAANQAKELYTDANVYIVPTKNLMQGFSAISVITPGITDMDMLVRNATRAAEEVIDIEVTKAVRHVTMSGKEINDGDYISISGGEITSVSESAFSSVLNALNEIDMDDYEIITLFTGKDVSEDERVDLVDAIEERYPDCEVTVYEGGQELYNYYIAVE